MPFTGRPSENLKLSSPVRIGFVPSIPATAPPAHRNGFVPSNLASTPPDHRNGFVPSNPATTPPAPRNGFIPSVPATTPPAPRNGFVPSDSSTAPPAAGNGFVSSNPAIAPAAPRNGFVPSVFATAPPAPANGFVPSTFSPAPKWVRFAIFLAAAAIPLAAQDARIDQIFAPWSKPATPGASVAVIQAGKVVYQKGYGAANLEYDIPITPDTIFHVASVSKQFTAMCIVLLEQDGKLTLDDDIHRYLPELPDYGHPITIRQLLQHTSGIRDQWQTLAIAGWRLDDVITQKQILRMLFRQRQLNFTPGARHLYSNAGFTLLAEIVARVSRKPFPQFADERIFRPLAMTRTHFHDDHQRIVPGRAYSYERSPQGYLAAPLNYANAGATSLFTTAPDLAKWLDNFRDPKVGGPRAIARMQEQAVLNDGTKVPYALGLAIGHHRGLPTISHGGSDAGYRGYVVYYPDQQLGIAILSNFADFNPGDVANRVAALYLERQMKPLPPPAAPNAVTSGERIGDPRTPNILNLADYTGVYWSDELETQYTFLVKDGKLIADHSHHGEIGLTARNKDEFRSDTWFMPDVKFIRNPAGDVTAVTLGGGRITAIRFVRK